MFNIWIWAINLSSFEFIISIWDGSFNASTSPGSLGPWLLAMEGNPYKKLANGLGSLWYGLGWDMLALYRVWVIVSNIFTP